MRRLVLALIVVLVAAGCGSEPAAAGGPVRLLFAGDVGLGGEVAAVAATDPQGLFEDVRFVVSRADVAAANLESPLTTRPPLGISARSLTASPAAAGLLAVAGFDAVAVANNHAGDAGAAGVADTLRSLEEAGVAAVGGGEDESQAWAPALIDTNGLRVALLAFDATRQGPAAIAAPGVAQWNEAAAAEAVAAARARADLVAVSLHGGIEYLPDPDPYLADLAGTLAGWGVDVVWCHGAHVPQPVAVIDPDGDDRPTVVATSLGNFLFDQRAPATTTGLVLEVVASDEGARAYRVGTVDHSDLRVHFRNWELPAGAAVHLDDGWWSPIGAVAPLAPADSEVTDFRYGDVIAAAGGDATGDGADEVVVAFRRPYRPGAVSGLYPWRDWADADGRSAHLGVYRLPNWEPVWVTGALFEPIGAVAICDTGLAVGYTTLDDPDVVAAGAWEWAGFGFRVTTRLPGSGQPGCADVDGDGRSDPVVLGRP